MYFVFDSIAVVEKRCFFLNSIGQFAGIRLCFLFLNVVQLVLIDFYPH
jgi:hypothetical protein